MKVIRLLAVLACLALSAACAHHPSIESQLPEEWGPAPQAAGPLPKLQRIPGESEARRARRYLHLRAVAADDHAAVGPAWVAWEDVETLLISVGAPEQAENLHGLRTAKHSVETARKITSAVLFPIDLAGILLGGRGNDLQRGNDSQAQRVQGELDRARRRVLQTYDRRLAAALGLSDGRVDCSAYSYHVPRPEDLELQDLGPQERAEDLAPFLRLSRRQRGWLQGPVLMAHSQVMALLELPPETEVPGILNRAELFNHSLPQRLIQAAAKR